jgi:hypothetical protein
MFPKVVSAGIAASLIDGAVGYPVEGSASHWKTGHILRSGMVSLAYTALFDMTCHAMREKCIV